MLDKIEHRHSLIMPKLRNVEKLGSASTIHDVRLLICRLDAALYNAGYWTRAGDAKKAEESAQFYLKYADEAEQFLLKLVSK